MFLVKNCCFTKKNIKSVLEKNIKYLFISQHETLNKHPTANKFQFLSLILLI